MPVSRTLDLTAAQNKTGRSHTTHYGVVDIIILIIYRYYDVLNS